ncbi:Barstar, RNAse (barnase) inhibitor [Chryseobacterium oleae]|uniref:Barstar, RNAse (Barnase) inhibitor n=1 Tax=Chryseobacterium oleae TaxID=491207 RepID=A0A1I4WBT5_CHROL|nr:barstar family protein [Chryseobacterium oleae]SFN10867.1 Barstar, RNAse (barnase) inhibitor [Chryseobacterium oleae]
MFGFAFDTATEPEIIAYMDDVKNIEHKAGIIYRTLRLINVDNVPNLVSAIKNAANIYENNGFICFLDDKSIVTRTFIGNIRVIKSKKNNITLMGQVWSNPPGYHKAMKMRLNNEITEKNIWKNFRKEELQGWLVYALHTMKIYEVKENISIEIDGNKFHNLDSFFCALGEEVNGIGGYFGRGIYALFDCLRSDFGVKSISELKWLNHQTSKKLFKTKFDEILQVFADHNVKVILE